MLRAYRIFCLVAVLLASVLIPFYLSSKVYGFAWIILLTAALAAGLMSSYVFWTKFIQPSGLSRGLRVAYAAIFAIAAASACLLALYVAQVEAASLVYGGSRRFEAGVAAASLLLMLAPPYAAWADFIRPLGTATRDANSTQQNLTAGALFVAFLLLVGPATYHLVVGN